MGVANVIVVGIDESEGAANALRWAVDEAAARHGVVRAVLAWTYLDQPALPGAAREFDPGFGEAAASKVLDAILLDRLGDGAGAVERIVSNDHAGPALVRHGNEGGLLVVGARGLGAVRAAALGSVSNYCLHHAAVPVAVIGPDAVSRTHNDIVVVGTDGSESAAAAVRWAAEDAAACGRELRVLVAWDMPAVMEAPVLDPAPFEDAARDVLAAALADLPDTGHAVGGQVVFGGAASMLIEASREAAVTVVGSRGRGGFRSLLLGATSHQVATHAHGPVVVVPIDRTAAT